MSWLLFFSAFIQFIQFTIYECIKFIHEQFIQKYFVKCIKESKD